MTLLRVRAVGWLRGRPTVALLVTVAVVVRIVWFARTGVLRGLDSERYLIIARGFADLRPTTHGFPLQVLYGVALAPAYVLGVPVNAYIVALHTAVSASTVLLLFGVARRLAGPRGAAVVGVLAAVFPTFLFWLPYVLTETWFLFVLGAFLYACVVTIDDRRTDPRRLVRLATLAAALVLSRPPGVLVAWVSAAVLAWTLVPRRRLAWTAGIVLTPLAVGLVLLALPPPRDRLLQTGFIGVPLWQATRVFNSDIDHVNRGLALPPELAGRTADELAAGLREQTTSFMSEHPGRYALQAIQRFGNYWFPALTAQWSSSHLVIDAVVSVGLVSSAAFALATARAGTQRSTVVLLVSTALVLALQIGCCSGLDSEARYRLPAEAALLPLAAVPVSALRQRRPGRGHIPHGRRHAVS